MGTGTQRARMREAGLYVQDAWRLRPTFTVNAGLRYELQFPFTPLNSSYSTATLADLCGISGVAPDGGCNLFQPGVTPGKRPEFINFGEGVRGYNVDYDNFAPSAGFAWTLGGNGGPFGRVLGSNQGDTVLRGGYARAFNRNGMNDFTGQYQREPGDHHLGEPDDEPGQPRRRRRLPGAAAPGPRVWAGRVPDDAAVPADGGGDGRHQPVRSRHPGAVRRHLDRRRAARPDAEHGGRGALRRHALARSLADAQLQRDEHLRERLPERVPGGPGQPQGEHRGGPWLELPVLRRGHRHDAAADHPVALPRHGEPGRPVAVHLEQFREQHVPRHRSRRSTRTRSASPAACFGNATPAGQRLARRPARRTSGSPIPTCSAAPISPPTTARPTTTRCRSSCAAGCRTACSSPAVTCFGAEGLQLADVAAADVHGGRRRQ